MRFNKEDPSFVNYKVELDGNICNDVIEADDVEGWVIIETKVAGMWGMTKSWPKKFFGKVFIIRYEGYDDETNVDEEKPNAEPSYV